MSFNLARLNHVFIPTRRSERDRLRRGWVGRISWPFAHVYFALSEEGRVAAIFALLAAFAGLDIHNGNNHWLWCGLFAPLVVAYLLRFAFPLNGVRMEVHGPDRLAVDAPGEIEITLTNSSDRDYSNIRVERPLLPWDGRWTTKRPVIAELPAGTSKRVRVAVRFSARGQHDLDAFRAVSVAPLGLTVGRGVEASFPAFPVVPRLARIERLELPMAHRYQRGGVSLASKIGESTELLGLRPYRRGDRMRDLHPRSWARLGEPVVREYQQEYFSRVGVILTTEMTKPDEARLEAAVSLTAGVVGYLTRGEALIDVLVTDGKIHPITVGRGLGHLEQVLDHLSTIELLRAVKPGSEGRRGRLRARLEGRQTLEMEIPEAWDGRLQPYFESLSCVIVIALDWGPRQRSIVAQISATGLSCRAVVLDVEADPAVATTVDSQMVSSGEAVFL